MKKLIIPFVTIILMASLTLPSCSLGLGRGHLRDRNLEKALLAHRDSISNIEYIGMSDVHELDGGKLESVIIYYLTDAVGNRTERNVRVITNNDCSQIYTWEDLDSKVLEDVKQKVSDKFEEKGIDIDGDLIDAIIKLKRR